MALIKCNECNGQVSSSAASCPHCGFPILKDFDYTNTSVFSSSREKFIVWKPARLFIGVMSILISYFLIKYSGIRSLEYILSGSEIDLIESGILMSFILFLCGVLSMCMHDSDSEGGLFLLGALNVLCYIFSDKNTLFSVFIILFAAFFFICGSRTKTEKMGR